MPNGSAAVVQKLWDGCNLLRYDGLSYGDYIEQLVADLKNDPFAMLF